MKKRCTDPACRRVFSTAGGRMACPHCGKEYRLHRNITDFSRPLRLEPRERGFGRLECVRRGGRLHMWLGPAVKATDTRPDRSRCTCVLMLTQVHEAKREIGRRRVLRGDDGFLRLRDAKAAVEVLMAGPAVLHTDLATARAIVDSGLFPVRRSLHAR